MLAPSLTTAKEAIASLMRNFTGHLVEPDEMELVSSGASGRSIMRANNPGAIGLLGVYWTADRRDNASFVPAALGLERAGIRAPRVLETADFGEGTGACIVQDLGRADLLSLKKEPWEKRRAAYIQTLRTLAPLHRLTPDWELQPPFDTGLYRWEQAYFAEHLLGRHMGMDDAADFASQPAMKELAETLAALPRVPVHRDCQSQNIMLYKGEAWLIDFQGMRYGLAEYDLASLVCDPYMELADEEQEDLLLLYQQIANRPVDLALYSACALQRLMQALGAYANIGYNQRKNWYLDLIPAGLRALRRASAMAPAGSPAARAAACLPNAI